jgi:serine/threonine-protein kinase HipA
VVQLYRRALFNVLAANDDDHGRNHAFLMDEAGGWSVAPAFDVTLATNPLASGFRAASVNGRAAGITRRDLLELGLSQDIASPGDILGEVAAAIAEWPAHAAVNGLSATQAHLVAAEHRRLQ